MTSIAFFQPTVFAFTAGIALVWTAAIAHCMRRDERSPGWVLVAVFAAANGAAACLGLLNAAEPGSAALRFLQLGLSAAGFVSLIEFGRRELRGRYRTLQKLWVYAPLIGVAAFKTALKGSEGLEAVCDYVLAPLGGLLAAVALAQRARRRSNVGWGLPLTTAAIAFFAIGAVVSAEALQAFAALGFLAGIWRQRRDESPFPEQTSAVVRWRAPGAFVVVTLLGCAGLSALGPSESGTLAVVQVGGAAAASNTESAAAAVASAEIDSRQLARERAAAGRTNQAVGLLVVVAVVAVVWVGLSKMSRRM